MRLFTFMLFFGSSIVASYLFGMTSIAGASGIFGGTPIGLMNTTGNLTSADVLFNPSTWSPQMSMNIYSAIMFFIVLAIVSVVVVGAFPVIGSAVSSGLSFASFYIFPALIFLGILAVFNFGIFPFSFLLDPGVPSIISMAVVGFYNILLLTATYGFIRGQI